MGGWLHLVYAYTTVDEPVLEEFARLDSAGSNVLNRGTTKEVLPGQPLMNSSNRIILPHEADFWVAMPFQSPESEFTPIIAQWTHAPAGASALKDLPSVYGIKLAVSALSSILLCPSIIHVAAVCFAHVRHVLNMPRRF